MSLPMRLRERKQGIDGRSRGCSGDDPRASYYYVSDLANGYGVRNLEPPTALVSFAFLRRTDVRNPMRRSGCSTSADPREAAGNCTFGVCNRKGARLWMAPIIPSYDLGISSHPGSRCISGPLSPISIVSLVPGSEIALVYTSVHALPSRSFLRGR